MHHAGVEPGDAKALVREEGVEGALRMLAAKGVYATRDELKGRSTVVRGSLSFSPGALAYQNPLVRAQLVLVTSGSSGRPLPVGHGLAGFAEIGQLTAAAVRAHGIRRPSHVCWITSPSYLTAYLHVGQPIVGWFRAVPSPSPLVTVWQVAISLMIKAAGAACPLPVTMPTEEPERMVRWLDGRRADCPELVVNAFASSAVRVSAAAERSGVDLSHVAWLVTGEPMTATRDAAIRRTGSRIVPRYGVVETGSIGFGCATRSEAEVDDIHVSTDRFALLKDVGPTESGLTVTTLRATAPRVLINADLGDDGDLEERQCDCLLGGLGLGLHVRNVRGVDKMTGESVTFAASDIIALVESELPRAFGGSAGDYQIAEVERADGIVQIVLRVDPRIGTVDELALRDAVLGHLAGTGINTRHMAEIIRRVGALVVRREPPVLGLRGKSSPFLPLRRPS